METKQKIHSFTDLEAWKKSHALVVSIYVHTKKYPKEEQFGITNQMRRAAVSITSNIAEGFSRISPYVRTLFLFLFFPLILYTAYFILSSPAHAASYINTAVPSNKNLTSGTGGPSGLVLRYSFDGNKVSDVTIKL